MISFIVQEIYTNCTISINQIYKETIGGYIDYLR